MQLGCLFSKWLNLSISFLLVIVSNFYRVRVSMILITSLPRVNGEIAVRVVVKNSNDETVWLTYLTSLWQNMACT